MFKLTYQKSRTYFTSQCHFKDIVENSNEKNENCWNHAACRFEQSCFEKNRDFKRGNYDVLFDATPTYFCLQMLLSEHKHLLTTSISI